MLPASMILFLGYQEQTNRKGNFGTKEVNNNSEENGKWKWKQ